MSEPKDAALAALQTAAAADPWAELRRHTPARIALGRAGSSLPTAELLRFNAAHAQARDAVHLPLDTAALAADLAAAGFATLQVHSQASTREQYLRRPDLGRRLDAASAERLLEARQELGLPPTDLAMNRSNDRGFDLCIVLADGLSAQATQRHALPLLLALRKALASWPEPSLTLAPLVIAEQARVALADEIGALLQTRAVLILLGERPGLSSPDSLGAYLTHAPAIGLTDALRNCVSNIRPAGLPYAQAAQRIAWLLHESLRRRLSGVALKDDSGSEMLLG
jgi:ethanolamine ammonia-lyase small subunit